MKKFEKIFMYLFPIIFISIVAFDSATRIGRNLYLMNSEVGLLWTIGVTLLGLLFFILVFAGIFALLFYIGYKIGLIKIKKEQD